jgi:hypothetical protein
MKVAVIGGSGRQGSRLIAELLARGHRVTAIARHPDRIEAREGVSAKQGDIAHPTELAVLLKGHDAVIGAVRFQGIRAADLLDAVRRSGVKRLLVVGGAASLHVAAGVRLFDTPGFPDAYKAEASAGIAFLGALKAEKELDWAFV